MEYNYSLKDVCLSLRAARLQENNILNMKSDMYSVNLCCIYIAHSYKISSDWYDINLIPERYQSENSILIFLKSWAVESS